MSQNLSDYSVHIPINPKLIDEQNQLKEYLYDFNHSRPKETAYRAELLKKMLGTYQGAVILQPFFCDMGKNIHFGEGGFLNTGVKILDIASVTFGNYVQIGPDVIITTAGHPLDLAQRVRPIALGNPITIGNSVWIGAGSIILDGVTIGDNSVIGAGSVVTKDIPRNSLALGNPARVIRTIEHGEMPSDEEIEAMWREVIEHD